jgi:hypothetical protein
MSVADCYTQHNFSLLLLSHLLLPPTHHPKDPTSGSKQTLDPKAPSGIALLIYKQADLLSSDYLN